MIGAAVMGLLVAGYNRFIWWPLHPIGYLTTYSSAMRILWYGGVRQFKEARRLFVGLVVGDMVMAIIWLIVGMLSTVA